MLRSYPRSETGRAALQARREPPPFEAWARRYLAASFTSPPSLFHQWLAPFLGGLHLRRGRRENVLAPRGAAKTTWSTYAYPLWCALHAVEPYIILTSDTSGQAEGFLEAVRLTLEDNALLARDYPHLTGRGPTWRKDQLRLPNGVVIDALGTGKRIRGRKNRHHRPSLIVLDDPQGREHAYSDTLRTHSLDWLHKDVCNAGDPATNIVCLGTALHRQCIVCELQNNTGWTSHVFRSIIEWPRRMDLWAEWKEILFDHDDPQREAKARAFYLRHEKEMNE